MGETQRPILHLPVEPADVVSAGVQNDQLAGAEGALEEITSLKSRLDAALEEIDQLRRRTENLRKGKALSRDEFFKRLTKRMGSDDASRACLVRVAITNAEELLSEHDDEALEEMCVSVGRWLAGHVRDQDLVGRVGMATYAVYFSYANAANINQKMNRLRARIERTPLTWRNKTLFPKIDIEVEDVGTPDTDTAATA